MAIRKLSNSSIITGTKSSKFWDQETFPGYFESIATINGTGASGTLTFSSIPSTYAHLQIRGILRSDGAGTGGVFPNMRFNNDTSSNYSRHNMGAYGSTSASNDNNVGATVTSIGAGLYLLKLTLA